MINIIQKGTSTVRATAEKLQYSGTFMEIPQLAVTVKSPTKIAWEIGDFITWSYDGATYVLKELPQEMKQSTSGTYGEAFVYENIRFIAPQGDLKYVDFLDVVETGSTSNFSTLPTFSFYGDCYDFIDRINANIGRLYANWEIKAADVESGDIFDALNLERNVEITSPIKVWDALGLFYSMWGLGFVYSYDTVNAKHNLTIGATGGVTGNFSYGQGNGLYMVSKNIAKEDAIVTRLRPYGSTRNMPARYYNSKIDFTNELIYLPNLMIPYAKWAAQNNDPKDAYINSNNPAVGSGDTSYAKYGIREASVYFDGTNNLPEIYPTISKITAAEVRAAITAYGAGEQAALYKSPNSTIYPDNTRMDKIKVGDVIEDDGVILTTNAYSETATFIGDAGLQPTSTKSNILKFDPIYFATLMNEGEYNIVFSEQTITASSIGTGDLAIINDSVLRLWIIRNGIRTTLISDISGTQVSEYIVTFTLPELSINVTEGGDGYSIEMEMEINFSDLDAGQDVSISWERDSGTATYSLAKVVPNREFTLKLKQVGFDIFRFLSSAGQRPVLSMIDGACGGREFIIKKADYNAATDDWSLICARQADTSLNNQWFPNANFHIAAEDTFVLLNINMPDIYITIAEERLFTEACKWLAKAKEPQWVYEPKIDEIYMAHNPQVIKEGMMMPLTDTDLAISGRKTINTVTITENEGAVRTFDVVLREDTDKDLLKYINDAAKNQSSSAIRGITNATTDKTESAENGTTASTSLSYTAENVVNKVSIINENSTTQQYVNAKALYDKFASFGTEYIKNQIASEQTADYWISGKAKAGTLIVPQAAPTLSSGEVAIYSLDSGFSGETPSGAGTLTSVALTMPTGFSVSGSPITESGTFGVTFASGYRMFTETEIGNKIESSLIGAANGIAPLDSGGKIALGYLPSTLLKYMGVWNASTNSPTLTSPDTNRKGQVWNVSVAGTQFGLDFKLGDWLIYNDSGVAEKSDNSDDVTSVNGYTGAVTLKTSDIAEQTNLYYTDARVKTYADTLYTPIAHGQITSGNPHGTTAADVGALAVGAKAADSELFDGMDSVKFPYGNSSLGQNISNAIDLNTLERAGFYSSYSPINSPTGSSIDETYLILQLAESATTGAQILLSSYGGARDRLFFRTRLSTWGSTKEIWHSGNSNSTSFNWSVAKLTSTTLLLPQTSPSLATGEMAIYGLESGFSGETPSGAGSVTSISMVVPTGLSVTPETITESGTFTISYASGYSIPTNTKQSEWDNAYTLRHNAVTLGTANGLSLSTQVLSLGLASTSTNGALSSTDWNTFNSKAAGDHNHNGTYALISGATTQDFQVKALTMNGALSGATTGSFSGNVSAASFTSGGNAVLHAGNYSSYALPLSGGTLSGVLNLNSGIDISWGGGWGAGMPVIVGNSSGIYMYPLGNTSSGSVHINGQAIYHTGNLTNTLISGYLPYWNGSSLVNSGIKQNSNEIIISGNVGSGGILKLIDSNTEASIGYKINGSTGNTGWVSGNYNDKFFIYSYTYGDQVLSLNNNGNVDVGYGGTELEKFAVNGTTKLNGNSQVVGSLTMTENINTNLRIPKVAPTSPTSGQYYFYIVE